MHRLLISIPPLLTLVVLVGLTIMALLRGRQSPANRLLAILLLVGSILYIEILFTFNAPCREAALRTSRLGHLVHPFLIPLFAHFFHAYLGIAHRRALLALAYVWATVLSAASPTALLIADVRLFSFGWYGQGGLLYPFMGIGAGLVTIYNLFIIGRAIQKETADRKKNKLRYIFTGFGLTGILICLNFLTLFGLPVYPPGCFGFITMGIFGAGVFTHDLLDMGVLIRKSLIYSMLTGLLTALYALIIISSQSMFRGTGAEDSIFFPFLLFGLITFFFGPVKNRTQALLDGLFAKNRYTYQQTIKQVSREIATVLDYGTITRLLQSTLIDTMGLERGAVYLSESDRYRVLAEAGYNQTRNLLPELAGTSPLIGRLTAASQPLLAHHFDDSPDSAPQSIGRVEFERLAAEVILPMRFKEQLKGFLVLGRKRSEDRYTREDLDLLETLCHQSALAIENAQAYQALHELNLGLEAKVAERTRDLATALEEKERTQELLIRAESLAALGQLVAGVAHELNNPLTSVTSLLQSIREELQHWRSGQIPDTELLDDLQFADRELVRAKSIVDSLLGLARQTQTYEEEVNLNLVIHDTLLILHNQYKHADVKLIHRLRDDLPLIRGNFANLGQVVLNVIQNAYQAVYEKSGGQIELTTEFDPLRRQIVFRCHDNGPGIDPAIRKDIFKPFFTTKPVGQGTGLGLYICHEIVSKHGGLIVVDPAVSHGARIEVAFPLTDD